MESTRDFWKLRGWRVNDVEGQSTEDLKSLLALLHGLPDRVPDTYADIFREKVGLISFELSRRGIAPRWQGLIGWRGAPGAAGNRKELTEIIRADARLYDLVWLREEFAGELKTDNRRWGELVSGKKGRLTYCEKERVSILHITERKLTRPALLELLGVSDWQQIGCIDLIRKQVAARIWELSAMIEEDTQTEAQRLTHMSQGAKAEAAERFALLTFAAGVLLPPRDDDEGDPPPQFDRWTDAGRVYAWITGKRLNRANVRRTLLRDRSKAPSTRSQSRARL